MLSKFIDDHAVGFILVVTAAIVVAIILIVALLDTGDDVRNLWIYQQR